MNGLWAQLILAGTTEGNWAGVRPSSGAAGSDPLSTLESSEMPLLGDVAAPEDGRTPVVPPRYAQRLVGSVFPFVPDNHRVP